jgi:hypothetical protein
MMICRLDYPDYYEIRPKTIEPSAVFPAAKSWLEAHFLAEPHQPHFFAKIWRNVKILVIA